MTSQNHNEGKDRPTMISTDFRYALAECVKVREWVDKQGKYDRLNYRESIGTDHAKQWLAENEDSIERHKLSIKEGGHMDPESGCYHRAHIIVREMMALEYERELLIKSGEQFKGKNHCDHVPGEPHPGTQGKYTKCVKCFTMMKIETDHSAMEGLELDEDNFKQYHNGPDECKPGEHEPGTLRFGNLNQFRKCIKCHKMFIDKNCKHENSTDIPTRGDFVLRHCKDCNTNFEVDQEKKPPIEKSDIDCMHEYFKTGFANGREYIECTKCGAMGRSYEDWQHE